jgi:hypothetical protein
MQPELLKRSYLIDIDLVDANTICLYSKVVLRVHELWKAEKPLEALKTCMELTGIKAADVSHLEEAIANNPLDTTCSKDNALFLNILQQLPSSW